MINSPLLYNAFPDKLFSVTSQDIQGSLFFFLFKSLYSISITGHVEVVKGEWIAGKSGGGSRNNLFDFATNPQFVLTLHEPGTNLFAY